MMRRFAIIQGGKVHQVLEAEERPEFAPYIQLIEITDWEPPVQEGWDYDEATGCCHPPPPPPPRPAPPPPNVPPVFQLPGDTEIRWVEPTLVDSYTNFANIWMAKHIFAKDQGLPGHKHDFDHIWLLAHGKAALEVEGNVTVYEGPIEVPIRKGLSHRVVALEDGVVSYCIIAVRNVKGEPIGSEFTDEQDPIFRFGVEQPEAGG